MRTLNYWLGLLNKLQLFGHGTKVLHIRDTNGKEYTIGPIETTADAVIIHIA